MTEEQQEGQSYVMIFICLYSFFIMWKMNVFKCLEQNSKFTCSCLFFNDAVMSVEVSVCFCSYYSLKSIMKCIYLKKRTWSELNVIKQG